jgi:hypothetical protein
MLKNLKNTAVYILDLAIENRKMGFGRFDSLALAVDEIWRTAEEIRENNRRFRMIKKEMDDFNKSIQPARSILDFRI